MPRRPLLVTNITVAPTAVDLPWSDFGRCVGVDPDVFFPAPGQDTSRAKGLCRQCPVRSQCLDWALATGQRHGVWGGMTPGQRRRLRRDGRPVSPPPARHLSLVR